MNLSHMLVLSVEGGRDPAGVEPVYGPVGESWGRAEVVGAYPLSSGRLKLPADGRSVAPRIGLGLMGEFSYGPNGLDGFNPMLFTAMDLPMLAVSEKGQPLVARLNWGDESIGVSDQLQFVDRFDGQGVLGRVRLAGWVEREGQWIAAAGDTPASAVGPQGESLASYIVFTVANQVAGEGWGEPRMVMAASDRPSHVLVCVGTAAPAPAAKSPVVVRPGDVVHAVAYDSAVIEPDAVLDQLKAGALKGEGVSHLARRVMA